MRARNLAVVLATIDRSGPHTRAALAERTGLTKTTVSSLVADLLEAGVVTESGAVRGGERGRPGVAVSMSGHRVAALGLEINIDYLAACVVDLTRAVRLRRVRPSRNRDSDPAEILEGLRDLVKEVAAEAEAEGLRLAGAALAVPGTVEDGVLRSAPHLGWRDVRVAGLVDLPVDAVSVKIDPFEIDNEANLAALGELWFGSREPDFLYVSGEIGIGAGLVVEGRVFRGTFGLAGELGHVVVVPDGPACRCGGRGCLEVYAGQDALLGELSSVGELVARLEAGDGRALEACEVAGHALGVALTSAVHLLDPGRIVLGGIFAPLYRWLERPVSEGLRARLAQMRGRPPALVVSATGGDAAVLGAAGLIVQQILAEPARLLGL
ncbi:ROK family transcriptional regulator [Nonomuraea sp. MG754425]|uniref:ROK family transcriptional regulator n=1 Tax=Nonomuraea sp. MG754425 TaxID=2570319 RepID=UPI001F3CF5AB|nr:ROK family transcriptional regulator [Nonomuraea sp. MG754425]MCF6466879.1 ROK family transcriptional regulator [Nonomuraea sp. MG754425]